MGGLQAFQNRPEVVIIEVERSEDYSAGMINCEHTNAGYGFSTKQEMEEYIEEQKKDCREKGFVNFEVKEIIGQRFYSKEWKAVDKANQDARDMVYKIEKEVKARFGLDTYNLRELPRNPDFKGLTADELEMILKEAREKMKKTEEIEKQLRDSYWEESEVV